MKDPGDAARDDDAVASDEHDAGGRSSARLSETSSLRIPREPGSGAKCHDRFLPGKMFSVPAEGGGAKLPEANLCG